MLDILKIKAVTIDLDDTLWPIWPVIERAEGALASWLLQHAPATAPMFADVPARLRLREHVVQTRPDIGHDMSALPSRDLLRVSMWFPRPSPSRAQK